MKKIFVLLPALMLSACASRYVAPTDPARTATLTTVHLTASFPSSTSITALSNPECKLTEGFGRINKVGKATDLSNQPKSAQVAAGSRLYLGVAGWTQGNRTYNSYTNYTCTNLVSFTPRAGGKYTVSQQVFPGNTCTAKVVDSDSGMDVPDLIRHPTVQECDVKGF